MARKELSASGKVIGVGVIALFIYFMVQIVMNGANATSSPRAPRATRQPSSLTVSRTNTPRPVVGTVIPTNTPAPSATFGWTKVPYEYRWATTEIQVYLRNCPELFCDVVVRIEANQSIRITNLVLGGSVDGNGDWFEIEHDGQLLYVPGVQVFSDTVTRMAMTASVFDVDDEMVVMPADVVFYQCPQLDCVEAGTISQGQRILITKMVAGEMVEGIQLWVVAVDSDGNEGYAPMVYVFPPTPTETATP